MAVLTVNTTFDERASASAGWDDRLHDGLTRLMPRAEELDSQLLRRLWVIVPECHTGFLRACQTQGKPLLHTLQRLHALCSDPVAFTRACTVLARHQARLGVEEFHYDALGAALLGALRELLGADYDEATETAWAGFYADIAETMLGAVAVQGVVCES